MPRALALLALAALLTGCLGGEETLAAVEVENRTSAAAAITFRASGGDESVTLRVPAGGVERASLPLGRGATTLVLVSFASGEGIGGRTLDGKDCGGAPTLRVVVTGAREARLAEPSC